MFVVNVTKIGDTESHMRTCATALEARDYLVSEICDLFQALGDIADDEQSRASSILDERIKVIEQSVLNTLCKYPLAFVYLGVVYSCARVHTSPPRTEYGYAKIVMRRGPSFPFRNRKYFDATPWLGGFIPVGGGAGAVNLNKQGHMLDLRSGRVYFDARFVATGEKA